MPLLCGEPENLPKLCHKERVLLKSAFSGQMMFRVNPEVHRKAALAAELAGKSLNQWAEEVLGKAAGVRHGRT